MRTRQIESVLLGETNTMSINDEVKDAIRAGYRTVDEIHEEVSEVTGTDDDGNPKRSPTRSYVNRILTDMLEENELTRTRNGRSFDYFINDESDDEGESDADAPTQAELETAAEKQTLAEMNSTDVDGRANMPVNRDYDHGEKIPSDVPPYVPSGHELAKVLASINTSDETGKLSRFLIGGPTGCGKTHMVRYIAQHLEVPMYTIQGKWALNESHLLGRPVLVNDTSWWVDGPLTKALLASQEGKVIVLVDEINRARPDSKGILFPAFDDRAEVIIEQRGGETITGNPDNLIAIGTLNEGSNYFNEGMDLAEIRRMSTKHNVDYLGLEHPDREAKLVAERTPASELLASMLVDRANKIRKLAKKQGSSVSMGLPTSSVISWAQEAYAYQTINLPNPIVEAAESTVIRPYYQNNENEEQIVREIINQRLNGLPFDEEGIAKETGKDVQSFVKELQGDDVSQYE
jgi:nitric oxide reductase NorQ protein